MCKEKQTLLAIKGWERLCQSHSERKTNCSFASKAKIPRDTTELDHARAIRADALAMFQKGFRVLIAAEAPDKPITQIRLYDWRGATDIFWADTDLYNLIEEAPEYATISDYALSVHEQFIK